VARRYNVLCWWLNSTRGNFNDRCQITQSEWCVTYHSVKNRPRRQSQHVRRIAAHHPVWHRPYCQLTPDSHGRRRLRPPRQRELRVGDTGRNSRTVCLNSLQSTELYWFPTQLHFGSTCGRPRTRRGGRAAKPDLQYSEDVRFHTMCWLKHGESNSHRWRDETSQFCRVWSGGVNRAFVSRFKP